MTFPARVQPQPRAAKLRGELRRNPAATISLIAVGDVSFSGRLASLGPAAIAPDVGDLLRGADLAFGNLECVLCEAAGPFAAPPGAASVLAAAGFRLLHLANNHALDWGEPSLRATQRLLHTHGIATLGVLGPDPARLVRTDRAGVRIGWLGAGRTGLAQPAPPLLNELDPDRLVEQVAADRSAVDVLIVSLHLGYMYLDYPSPEHRRLAHRLARAGADLVLMHHAHVLQPIEVIGRTVVCYNLGDFLLDWQEGEVVTAIRSDLQRCGAVFRFECDRQGVARYEVLPTRASDDCRVAFASEELARSAVARLERLGCELQRDYEPRFEMQRAALNTALGVGTIWRLLRSGRLAELLRLLRRARREHLSMLLRFVLCGAREPAS